jgi:exosortase E/protease (VPEID-CTERM system)
MHLAARLGLVAVVLAVEGVVLSLVIRGVPPAPSGTAAAILQSVHAGQGWMFRLIIAYGGSLAILILSTRRQAGVEWTRPADNGAARIGWLIAHGLLLTLLVSVSGLIGAESSPALSIASAAARPVLAMAAGLALFGSLAPFRFWRSALLEHRRLFVYAALMAVAAVLAIDVSHRVWEPSARLTFRLVEMLLRPFYPGLHVDPSLQLLATDRFGVVVTDYCSGLEGVGLMLVFCAAWLWYFRADYRFPRALLIIPAAVMVIFGLNSIRIAVLLSIGDAGYPRIASTGFHSQAGWIAFNIAAFAIAVLSKRSRWLTRAGADAPETADDAAGTGVSNPVTPFLLPLAVILAIGMATRLFSDGFDFLYPLRFGGALCALWIYRTSYRKLDWRFSWRAVGMGTLTFAVWALAAHVVTTPQLPPSGLAGLSAAGRIAWIAMRVGGAIVTVPIAEELAYRGYLMRRLTRRNFEEVSYREVRWPALLISAVAFGAVHGMLWWPAVLAGLAYGWLAIRTGRIGEAIAAHALTNALLAGYVLIFGQWQLW